MAIVRCTRRKDVRDDERIVSECDRFEDTVHAVSYEGATLSTRERNGYHDSDFYATVYDADANEVRSIEYATTRGWTYHNSATVDADEATVELAVAAQEAVIRETTAEVMAIESRAIARDARVEFIRAFNGKKQAKVEKGATGRVFWHGDNRYGYGKRAGVKLDDGEKVFVADDILARTGAAVDADELEARVARKLANLRHQFTAQARKAAA